MNKKELVLDLLMAASALDKMGLTKEADKIDQVLTKLAQAKAEAYYQRDPVSGMHRGILEHVDAMGTVTFLPEKPLVDKDLEALKRKLEGLVPGVPVNHKGVGEPWLAESNMPFDLKGNRVA